MLCSKYSETMFSICYQLINLIISFTAVLSHVINHGRTVRASDGRSKREPYGGTATEFVFARTRTY